MIDSTDEWIYERSGIRNRRWISGDETARSMAASAAERAISNSGIPREKIGALILATNSWKTKIPHGGPIVAYDIGLNGIPAYDIAAGCGGFGYALGVAADTVRAGAFVGDTRTIRRITDAAPDVVALLADDELGATREVGDAAEYDSAFELVTRDRSQYLAVIRDDAGHVVGTMHLTVIPGLSRSGSTRLQIEGVRVARGHRSQGLGTAMIEWAHHHGRTHGAVLSQLTTDVSRDRARAFYTRLGYRSEHVGLKRTL